MKKIELNFLLFILIEGCMLLFFFKESLMNMLIGGIIGIILSKFGKKFPKNRIVYSLLFIIYIILIIIMTNKLTNFISFNILRNYPIIIITISFLIVSIYLINRGYHAYIKSLEIIFYFYLFFKVFSLILLIPLIDLQNFNYQLIGELHVNYHFIEISLFIFFINLSIELLCQKNLCIKDNFISLINPFFIKLLSISILGYTLFNIYEYPYVNVLKRIKYFDFIERMEGLLSFEYLITFIFLLSFLLLMAEEIFKQIKKKS